MELQFSLLIDTSLTNGTDEFTKRVYSVLLPSDVSVNSKTKEYLMTHTVQRTIENKQLNFRYIQNFINNTVSIEIFLNESPDSTSVHYIKDALRNIPEITGYRLMKIQTKIRIEIDPI